MKARALKPFTGQHGRFRRGQEFDAPEPYVQFLVKKGMAVPLEAAKKAPARPSTGGQTGKEKPSSSSQEDQASKTSRSTKSEDDAE